MGTRVNVQICVASVIETHIGEDKTEEEIIKALGVVPIPRGPKFAPLMMFTHNTQAHSHDINWGTINYVGYLINYKDEAALLEWWKAILLILAEHEHMSISMGSLQYQIDSQPWAMIDHVSLIVQRGDEVCGDDTVAGDLAA